MAETEPTLAPQLTLTPPEPARQREADLRAEAAAERIAKKQAQEQTTVLQGKLDELLAQTETRVTTEVGKVTAKLGKIQARVIEAELKVAAQQAGLQDLDLLPLVDRSKLKLTDDDEVTGAKEALEELKGKKPEWFKVATGAPAAPTGTSAPPPAGGGTGGAPLNAKKMTPVEYAAFKQKTLRDLRH